MPLTSQFCVCVCVCIQLQCVCCFSYPRHTASRQGRVTERKMFFLIHYSLHFILNLYPLILNLGSLRPSVFWQDLLVCERSRVDKAISLSINKRSFSNVFFFLRHLPFFGVMKDISTNSKTNLALMQHMLTLRISLMNLR